MKAFGFCHGIVKELKGLVRTLEGFVGGLGVNPHLPIIGSHVPEYMENTNLHFLSEVMEYTMEPRANTKLIDFDPSLI